MLNDLSLVRDVIDSAQTDLHAFSDSVSDFFSLVSEGDDEDDGPVDGGHVQALLSVANARLNSINTSGRLMLWLGTEDAVTEAHEAAHDAIKELSAHLEQHASTLAGDSQATAEALQDRADTAVAEFRYAAFRRVRLQLDDGGRPSRPTGA